MLCCRLRWGGLAVEKPSRVAVAARALGVLGIAAVALGPLLIHLGVAPPMTGFTLFGVGAIVGGLLALLLGLVGLWLTRPAAGRSGRGPALTGLLLGAALLSLVVVAGSPGRGLPPINDITTDLDDPPAFVVIAQLEANRDRDMSYPGDAFSSAQRTAYSDLEAIQVPLPPPQAFVDARRAAGELGWQIVSEAPAEGRLEASDTTPIFRFVDDVVVRIRPADGGSILDVRSKSRDGRGDLGANAARIRAFREALGS